MGYIKHNAVIVTGWEKVKVEIAHSKAIEIFNDGSKDDVFAASAERLISPILEGISNSQYSFFIAPDGSKEGWDTSDMCDQLRERFLDWLQNEPNNWCDYIDVRFGGDDDSAFVIRDKDSDLNK